MKTTSLLLLILFFVPVTTLLAQFSETIVSDRPGQSNSPYTVGKMVLQLQTGAQFEGGSADNYERNIFSMPVFFRFGITDKIEVQTLWGYQNGNAKIYDFDFTAKGIDLADFGLKFNIFEETAKAPAPHSSATSTVPSLLPPSTTITSPSGISPTRSRVCRIFPSSLSVGMTTEMN